MAYKWKPNASQRREFAERMQNPESKAEYLANKEAKAAKRRSGSKFDYASAGGQYIPTKAQYDAAFNMQVNGELTGEQKEACNQVMFGYGCQEAIHHDHIHIINEYLRKCN